MKIRDGWVSNSSSTSFVIHNMGQEKLTLVEFVKLIGEDLLKDFLETYDFHSPKYFTFESMMNDAQMRFKKDPAKYTIKGGEKDFWIFGDSQGDVLGHIFDYMLRDGGRIDEGNMMFRWYVDEYLR